MSTRFTTFKLPALIALLLALAGCGFWKGIKSLKNGESGAKIWLYDQSQKRLYTAPAGTIPPHKGVGGKSGDGVLAIVVDLGPNAGPGNRAIAYLQSYAPPLKSILDQAKAAHDARKTFAATLDRESDFFITNTLVRTTNDPVWHPINSPEGQLATTQWRSWRGPNGEPPAISVP